jgi:hypothetical protein
MTPSGKAPDLRALSIVGLLAVAAGVGRWWMDGSSADGAKLLAPILRDPLKVLSTAHSLAVLALVPSLIGTVWLGFRVWAGGRTNHTDQISGALNQPKVEDSTSRSSGAPKSNDPRWW